MTDIAKIGYEAYCSATGGKSLITGDILPPFENLRAEIKHAWLIAARAVLREAPRLDPYGEQREEEKG